VGITGFWCWPTTPESPGELGPCWHDCWINLAIICANTSGRTKEHHVALLNAAGFCQCSVDRPIIRHRHLLIQPPRAIARPKLRVLRPWPIRSLCLEDCGLSCGSRLAAHRFAINDELTCSTTQSFVCRLLNLIPPKTIAQPILAIAWLE